VQRQEALAAIIAIITGLFLLAMDGVLGVIEVKDDKLGWTGVGGDKLTPCGRTFFLRHVSDTPPSSHL
jgi:hypothetical protein